jgi:hypothetical protein
MIRIYKALDSMEAHIVRGFLESRGIPARVEGDYLQGGVGELPALGLVAVIVPDEYRARAEEVLREYETGQGILSP